MGVPSPRNFIKASMSSLVMLLDINGHVFGGEGTDTVGEVAVGKAKSLFIVIVAIFHENRALSVGSFQRLLIGWKNHFRFVEADDLRVHAHQPERVSEISDVLKLRMERPLGSDACPDDYLGLVTSVGHQRELIEMVHQLTDSQ